MHIPSGRDAVLPGEPEPTKYTIRQEQPFRMKTDEPKAEQTFIPEMTPEKKPEPAETPLSENQVQYNTYNSIQKNQLLSDKSSIIPAVKKPTFNISGVEKSAERVTDGYNAEEVEYFTEVVRDNLDY